MPTMTVENIVLGWRTDDLGGWDNPAGPLFPSSAYAAAEITSSAAALTCSACTASRTGQCC